MFKAIIIVAASLTGAQAMFVDFPSGLRGATKTAPFAGDKFDKGIFAKDDKTFDKGIFAKDDKLAGGAFDGFDENMDANFNGPDSVMQKAIDDKTAVVSGPDDVVNFGFLERSGGKPKVHHH